MHILSSIQSKPFLSTTAATAILSLDTTNLRD